MQVSDELLRVFLLENVVYIGTLHEKSVHVLGGLLVLHLLEFEVALFHRVIKLLLYSINTSKSNIQSTRTLMISANIHIVDSNMKCTFNFIAKSCPIV